MSNNEHKIQIPFYQVKSFGKVIEHTNSMEAADRAFRDAGKPAEIWKIGIKTAELMRRS